ncbi:MAG: SRPBCC domain-containing protein [Acidimicrobiales bacterium]
MGDVGDGHGGLPSSIHHQRRAGHQSAAGANGPLVRDREISLHLEDGKTRVRLTHRGLPADAVDDHTGGWHHYLDRLATRATGGVPGPDIIEAS